MCLVKGLVKFLLFGFNFVFLLVGIGLITLGVLYKVDFDDIHKAIPDDYSNFEIAPTLTIVVGSIILVIAFFGCCGVIRNSVCLLNTYALILLIIFFLQVGLAIFTFIKVNDKNDLQKEVNRTLENLFKNYDYDMKQMENTQSNPEPKKGTKSEIVDIIQQELKCCGLKGPGYWKNVPKSCCADKDCSKNKPYSDGCQKSLYDFLIDASKTIGIVLLCLAATLILGAIVALCLANSIRNESRRSHY